MLLNAFIAFLVAASTFSIGTGLWMWGFENGFKVGAAGFRNGFVR